MPAEEQRAKGMNENEQHLGEMGDTIKHSNRNYWKEKRKKGVEK